MSDIKSNERLSKKYVDDAVDGVRVHAENLFQQASKRVSIVLDEKLKAALATIRPPEPVKERATIEPTLPERNAHALRVLLGELSQAAVKYENSTGFRVKHVVFDRQGREIVPRPMVTNL